jgi:predicted Zn-dependent peptidase
MEDLNEAALEDVAHFFATYYTPDNAVLSIAGDFDPAEARALVERFFGDIPRGRGKPSLPSMAVPETFGEWRRERVEDAVMLARLFLAFRIPPYGTEEHEAASIAGAVLGLKRGSRLHRALVRERQVAADASAFTFDLTKGSDLLVLDVTARPEIDGETLEREVAREVDAFRANGVSQEELDRAIALVETGLVVSLQAAGDRAEKLSLFATYFGNPALVNEQVDRYRAVTRERVDRFVRRYLGEDNRASLLYVPREPIAERDESVELAVSTQ